MKVSIITVCFNAGRTIVDTLNSVASQSYPDIEHIVVDGGSSDDTAALVRTHGGRVATFLSEPDRGVYDGMNKGLNLATGDIVAYLNADDVYADPDVVSRVVNAFAESDVEACYANLVYVDRERIDRVVRVWRSRDFEPGLFRRGWMPAHPTLFVKRRALLDINGFDLNFHLQSDFDLTMRLFEVCKIRSRFIPEVWVHMREGGMSNANWRNVVRGNVEAFRICWKNGLRVGPWFVFVKVASRLGQFIVKKPSVNSYRAG